MVRDYEILEHIADLKIRAYGRRLEEVFSNMLKGMFESLRPEIVSEQPVTREVRIKSQNLESLLIDFLSEALYLSDVNNEAYFEAKFEKFPPEANLRRRTDQPLAETRSETEKEITAKIKGKKIENAQLEIKAATWHDLEIKKEGRRWQATVLFDI